VEIAVDGSQLVVSVADGSEFDAGAMVELMTAARPGSITIDGQPLSEAPDVPALAAAAAGWTYTGARAGTLWIKLPAGGAAATVSAP
jgi:hypothetical protein